MSAQQYLFQKARESINHIIKNIMVSIFIGINQIQFFFAGVPKRPKGYGLGPYDLVSSEVRILPPASAFKIFE